MARKKLNCVSKEWFFLMLSVAILSSCGDSQNRYLLTKSVLPFQQLDGYRFIAKRLDGTHCLGIRCSKKTWDILMSSDLRIQTLGKELELDSMGKKGTLCNQIDGCRFLTTLSGIGEADVSFAIKSVDLQLDDELIEIYLTKSPQQTKF